VERAVAGGTGSGGSCLGRIGARGRKGSRAFATAWVTGERPELIQNRTDAIASSSNRTARD